MGVGGPVEMERETDKLRADSGMGRGDGGARGGEGKGREMKGKQENDERKRFQKESERAGEESWGFNELCGSVDGRRERRIRLRCGKERGTGGRWALGPCVFGGDGKMATLPWRRDKREWVSGRGRAGHVGDCG
jgi:hypothetical protein